VDWRHLHCSDALGGVGDTASEIPDPTIAVGPDSAAEFSRTRDPALVVLRPIVAGCGAASGLDRNSSALCVLRHAIGNGARPVGCTDSVKRTTAPL
jgi:hypothetical protein